MGLVLIISIFRDSDSLGLKVGNREQFRTERENSFGPLRRTVLDLD